MKLSVEIHPDLQNSIAILDLTRETGEYVDESIEEVLFRYYNFKYSQTCTINVIKEVTSLKEEIINAFYSEHTTETDSVRVILPHDGFFSITHLVLPTLDWLNAVKNEDLSEYSFIYVTDGFLVFKYANDTLTHVDIEEVIEVNPDNTTISVSTFKVFNTDGLKQCYVEAAKRLLNNAITRCKTVDDEVRFNRDFLWMTINVINYYLEWDQYSEALIVLENIGCANLCPQDADTSKSNSGCGCHR